MRICHDQGMFYGTLLVADRGTLLYLGAFGYANRETKEPLGVDSAFYLASVSKQFTAMGVLLLEQDDRLSLKDTLDKFFPEFPDFSKRIEIRHLLTHTSGIPDHFRLGAYEPGLTNEKVLAVLAEQPALDFEPGERFSYSNGGYVLLSLLVERVSGQSLGRFLQARIFEPLSMKHSLVFEGAKPRVPHRVLGYDASGTLDDYDILTTGAGGIYSTATDLFRWDRALYTEKLLPAAALERAFSPAQLNSGQLSQYGYGWKTHEGSKTVDHSGGLSGFRTYIERQRATESTLIVLTNGGASFVHEEILGALRHILADEPFEVPRPEASVALPLLTKYAGQYRSQTHPLRIKLSVASERLLLQATGQPRVTLQALSDQTFVFRPAGVEMTFAEGGQSFVIEQNGQKDVFIKGAAGARRPQPAVEVALEVLKRYEGTYHSPTFPLDVAVRVEGSSLVAQASGQPAFPLDAVSATEFVNTAAGIRIEFDAAKGTLTLRQGAVIANMTRQ